MSLDWTGTHQTNNCREKEKHNRPGKCIAIGMNRQTYTKLHNKILHGSKVAYSNALCVLRLSSQIKVSNLSGSLNPANTDVQ